MAAAALNFLVGNLTGLIFRKAALTGAEDIVRWIEDELEWIIPQFARIEALPQRPKHTEELIGGSRDVIRRAEDLIDTYAKSASKAKAANYKKPIYLIKLRSIRKELQRIGVDFARARYNLNSVELELLSSHSAGEQNLPESEDVMPGSESVNQGVPPYLRQCIYYFLLFPANYEVPSRRLIVLWVAEGLAQPKKYDNESVEHIAERYLNELIDLKVVYVTDTKRNGKVKACQLKDGTRGIWLRRAQDDKFLQNRNGNIHRLVDHNGSTADAASIQIHGNPSISHSVTNYGDVISFLSFDTQEGSKPGEDIGDFLHKCISAGCFKWLRVLDLERVFRPRLPKTLGKLTGLKYLGLRWTYLEHLPKFVNMLFNLQVLDVKHTYINVLPRSIWTMQYLRHLYLSEAYRTRFPERPSGAIPLTALQTLWGPIIDENTCVTGGLDASENIRKLGLSCRPSRSTSQSQNMSQQLRAVDKWISNLKFLESLRLKSLDKHGKAADLHLSSLEGNRNLSTVYLLGKLDSLVVCAFPVSLTDITLSASELDLDPMEFLGRLPNLQILRLLSQSVVHNRMHCSRKGFPRLKFLCFWKLENLEEWEAEEGSLPSLKELEIRSCAKLKMLPDGLQHVRTLRKVRLTSMPEGFIDQTKIRQPKLWAEKHVLEVDT